MMKMNLQYFGGRGSAGGSNTAEKSESLARRAEKVRDRSEARRVAAEAKAEAKKGVRNWNPEVNTRISDVSYSRAENELFNAPVGTVITMDNHNTGDYVGEYTRTATGWVGSQRYSSDRVKPNDVKTAAGFASAVTGNDIKVVKTGTSKRKK